MHGVLLGILQAANKILIYTEKAILSMIFQTSQTSGSKKSLRSSFKSNKESLAVTSKKT